MINDAVRNARLRQLAAGIALAATVIAGDRARAAITDAAPNGFTVSETAHIAAPSDGIYAALIVPAHWWSRHHTFSGDSANLTFDAKAGGCWCETLPGGGSVQHMTVVYAVPGKILRLRGAMGPFQAMAVQQVMTWSLTPANGGTDVTLVASYGGYTKDGFDTISHIVDRVMGEQLGRLKSYVETGSPESAAKPKDEK